MRSPERPGPRAPPPPARTASPKDQTAAPAASPRARRCCRPGSVHCRSSTTGGWSLATARPQAEPRAEQRRRSARSVAAEPRLSCNRRPCRGRADNPSARIRTVGTHVRFDHLSSLACTTPRRCPPQGLRTARGAPLAAPATGMRPLDRPRGAPPTHRPGRPLRRESSHGTRGCARRRQALTLAGPTQGEASGNRDQRASAVSHAAAADHGRRARRDGFRTGVPRRRAHQTVAGQPGSPVRV